MIILLNEAVLLAKIVFLTPPGDIFSKSKSLFNTSPRPYIYIRGIFTQIFWKGCQKVATQLDYTFLNKYYSQNKEAPETIDMSGFECVLRKSKRRLKNRLSWLRWQDSNLRMRESKSRALPLGDTSINYNGRTA